MLKHAKKKQERAARRAKRVRAKIHGTSECPRLSVFRSSKHISAQMIDDQAGKTLVSASDKQITAETGVEIASLVGEELAKKAKAAGITKAIFDRGPYMYHGRVKALAEAARKGGIEF